jgi:hypothetical protein
MKIIIPESILAASLELLRSAREIHFDPRSFADRTALTAAPLPKWASVTRL